MSSSKRMLVNWVYAGALGHAIEAFKQANAFKKGSPDLDVSVMINSETGVELADHIASIATVYPIDLRDFADDQRGQQVLESLPCDWDYVFTDYRAAFPCGFDERIDRFHKLFRLWVRAGASAGGGREAPSHFPELKPSALVIQLPASDREYAAKFWQTSDHLRVTILPSSGSHQKAPPVGFWTDLIVALREKYIGAEFTFVGVTGKTLNFGSDDVIALRGRFAGVRNGFDLGLLRQLAIIEQSDLYISPHSGMSFAAQCVGTPWLVISGTIVHEYFFNGVPFRCVYPDCDVYPCVYPLGDRMLSECKNFIAQDRVPLCMQHETLSRKLFNAVSAAEDLIEGRHTYVECIKAHVAELNSRGIEGVPLMDGDAAMRAEYTFPALGTRLDRVK